MYSCEIWKIFKDTYDEEYLGTPSDVWTASGYNIKQLETRSNC